MTNLQKLLLENPKTPTDRKRKIIVAENQHHEGEYEFHDEIVYEDEAHRFVEPVIDAESDPFLHSLEYLKPDDIAPPEPKVKKTWNDMVYTGVRGVLFAISVTVFCISAVQIIMTLYNYKRANDIYDAMASDFYAIEEYSPGDGVIPRSPGSSKSAVTPDIETSLKLLSSGNTAAKGNVSASVYNDKLEKAKLKLNYLKAKNEDICGWITIADTKIDYAMVQGDDNDYYLHYSVNKDYLPAGSIFVDYRCNPSIMKNYNTVIYGHNMTNGMMFNNITKFLDQSFFDSHPYIEISTLDGIYTYLVFAIYQTDMYYKYIQTDFYTRQDFVDFAYEMKANSLFERPDVEFSDTDRMITLSTCTNGRQKDRYTLQAKLVGVTK